jgi:hypothetical protein
MSFPTMINTSVSQRIIGKVTRLWAGSVADALHEAIQNGRRAGAKRIDIAVVETDRRAVLRVRDDGCSIADPVKFLALGDSGWDETIAKSEDPFAGFFDLWSDPGFLGFYADLSIRGDPEGRAQFAFISGDDVDVHSIASLIQKVCKSALPFGFQWAEVCDKDQPDTFGGGYYVITDAEIFGGPTRWLMDETLQTLRAGA